MNLQVDRAAVRERHLFLSHEHRESCLHSLSSPALRLEVYLEPDLGLEGYSGVLEKL